jgi:hypothetical protein
MGVGTAIGIGGIAASGIGAAGAAAAGGEQAGAANNAAALQSQEQQNSLDFQKQQWNTQQQNEAPWLQAGQSALGQLNGGKLPGFQAPTAAQAQQTPGYQFQLQQGTQALENSAAAKGGLIGGNEGEALQNYGQGLASENYQQTYNNAMNEYNTNVLGPYNRLASLAGVGQQAANTLGQEGQAASSNVSGINATAGQQIGQNINNAGAANASGYVGIANSLGGGVNNLGQSIALSQLLGGQQNNPYGSGEGQLNPETTPLPGGYT